ncbi:MAG: hypothetical protein ACK4S4_04035 [Pyrinomonadaceae bacterium]
MRTDGSTAELRCEAASEIARMRPSGPAKAKPSNWRSEWQRVIEEKRSANPALQDVEDIKTLLRDLFG